MDFVNEQDGAGCFQFVDDAFQAFLELPAVHGASNQRTNVQLQHPFTKQRSRHITFHDALRQAFDDGSFAHSRFTDQGRVIFVAACQDLNDTFDFHLAADDRIQFILFG